VPVSKKPIEHPHGQRQGHARILGLPRQARPHFVRVDGIPLATAKEALALAAAKLPVKTRFIERIAE